MKFFHIYLLPSFLIFVTILTLSCEKKAPEISAKDKALKEKVAALMAKEDIEKNKKPKVKKKQLKAKDNPQKIEKKDEIAEDIKKKSPNEDLEKIDKNKDIEKTKEKALAIKAVQKIKKKKQVTLKPAVIQIIANFDNADATVNGKPYPEYTEAGKKEGMVVPAGGPYEIEVKFGNTSKYYELYLKPYETRLLFVSSGGGSESKKSKPPKKKVEKKKKKEEKKKKAKKKENKAPGKVTVYAKPDGMVYVDGKARNEKTPATIEVPNGRHEIQVKYEGESELSDKKIVRVRSGSKIKIFFRLPKK